MKSSLWYKRIPTLLGLFLLGAGLLTITWLINSGTLFTTEATPPYTPENIRITNLSDTSFTISFTTAVPVLGTLSYGTSPSEGNLALDDRDQQEGSPRPYVTHHITVRNLKPATEYFFSITASDKTFLDEDRPFSVTTLEPLTQKPSLQPPIVGKVTYADGTTDNNIIVLLVTDNAQVLSVLTNPDGSFVMPLNALRTSDYTSYLAMTDASIIKLLALGTTDRSSVSVRADQINPVPLITLGNTYDFTTSVNPIQTQPTASSSAETEGFPSFSATESTGAIEPRILTPSHNESFSDQQPEFEGTAPPNQEIEIIIHSEQEIKTKVKTSRTGTWSFRPDVPLAPGEHTITIIAKDSAGILRTIKRSFTVFAEGSQFTEPSVSPQVSTPTPTPEVIETPTPTPIPTDAPTPTLIPTATQTPMPTPTTPVAVTSIVPPPSEPPGSSLMLLSGIIATLTIGTGSLLFFLARGKTL